MLVPAHGEERAAVLGGAWLICIPQWGARNLPSGNARARLRAVLFEGRSAQSAWSFACRMGRTRTARGEQRK